MLTVPVIVIREGERGFAKAMSGGVYSGQLQNW